MLSRQCLNSVTRAAGFSSFVLKKRSAQKLGVLRARAFSAAPRWKSTIAVDDTHDVRSERIPSTAASRKPDPNRKLPIPDFSDAQAAYESKTTMELLRAMVVFQLCRIPFLVRHADSLLYYSRKVMGGTLQDLLLRATLFGHFCAGEDEEHIHPVIKQMEKRGIGSILDYAHEDDGSGAEQKNSDKKSPDKPDTIDVDTIFHEANPKVRLYDYESEAQCDRHVETFKSCINAVKNLNADGYAAMKVTALGNPKLLEKMSRALREVKNLYSKFDVDNDGSISRDEFEKGYKFFFKDSPSDLDEMFELLDADQSGRVDFITWSMMLTPRDLPRITSKCREIGPLALVSPTEEEVELMEAMFNRGHELAKEAAKCGTRLLIDAEQFRFQPAIDNLVLDLQRTYNSTSTTDSPIIYNTYQCYLKDAFEHLKTDLERAERYDYHFGAKLVRGAYMEGERALAESLGYPSPIHDTIEETHQCYNDAAKYLLNQSVESERKVEMMIASHNQESIEKAIAHMDRLGIDPQASTICFAQLYGMTDNLTYNLGQNGFRAYKYVPYGKVGEVMPYLVRRAKENSAITGGAPKELNMIRKELKRRVSFA